MNRIPANVVVINRYPWHNLMYMRNGYELRQDNLTGWSWPYNVITAADDNLRREDLIRVSDWTITECAISATLADKDAPRCDSCGQVTA